jgi:spore coat protein U-like protein
MFRAILPVRRAGARTMPHLARKAALATILTALATPASAAQCDLAVTPIVFGAYDPFAGPRDGSGAVAVTCNGNASAVVQLGAGRSGDANDRQMAAAAGDVLRYNVYENAARSQVFTWATAAKGTTVIPLHGRIFGNQPVPPGTYQDALVVTVNY